MLLAHSRGTPNFPADWVGSANKILFDGYLGVRFFFVISGFLITYLLLQEHKKNGYVSLKDFYLRRALRILPVYCAFLAVIAALQIFTGFHQSILTWVGNLTFTIDFLPRSSGWVSAHLWSLSVEEQFYLLWPVILLLLIQKRKMIYYLLAIPIVIALVSNLIIWGDYFPPVLRGLFHLHSPLVNFDALAVGCFAAFLMSDYKSQLIGRLENKGKYVAMGIGLLLILMPEYLSDVNALHLIDAIFGNTLAATGFAILLITSILVPQIFKPLNSLPMIQLGLLSYSIYIWQQIFCSNYRVFGWQTSVWWMSFPGWFLPTFIVAIMSYYGLERPLLKLRARFHSK